MIQPLCQPDLFQHCGGERRGFRALHPAYQQRHRDIFQRGEFRQQVMELVDEAERTVAHFAALRFVHLLHILPEYLHAAAAGIVQSAEQMQQRALARTGCADDRDTLAALQVEVDTLQHRHIHHAQRECLAQIAAGNHSSRIAVSPQGGGRRVPKACAFTLSLTHSAAPPPVAFATPGSSGRGWRAG